MEQSIAETSSNVANIQWIIALIIPILPALLTFISAAINNPNFFKNKKYNSEKFKLENIYSPIVYEFYRLSASLKEAPKSEFKIAYIYFLSFAEKIICTYSFHFPKEILKLYATIVNKPDLIPDELFEFMNFIFWRYDKCQNNLRLYDQTYFLELKVGKRLAALHNFYKKSFFWYELAIVCFEIFCVYRIVFGLSNSNWILWIFLVIEAIYGIGNLIVSRLVRSKVEEYDSQSQGDQKLKDQLKNSLWSNENSKE